MFPSSQSGGGPPAHAPPLQVSAVVQALPSSHGAVLLVFTQPVAESHESSVHTLPSSQSGEGPPTHTPPAHVSAMEHASPSSHAAVLSVFTQPVAESHESSVHTLPSSQFVGGPPSQNPRLLHASPDVQASPSSQEVPVAGVCLQKPSPVSQVSIVQGLPSSH